MSSFMFEEIWEQPQVLRDCLSWLEVTSLDHRQLAQCLPSGATQWQQIQIIGCGSSFHAGLVGKYWLEQLAGIPVSVHLASEFRYSPPPVVDHTLTIGITQSGRTTDTLAALALEQVRHGPLLAITNHSTPELQTLTNCIWQTPAAEERAIAATKSFMAQLVGLLVLALRLAHIRRRISEAQLAQKLADLQGLPALIQAALPAQDQQASRIAPQLQRAAGCVFLGRGVHYPIALEAALKVKETSYIFAEGYAEGEFSHGPVAILENGLPVVTIALPLSPTYPLTLAAVERMQALGARVIGVTTAMSVEQDRFDHVLQIPAVSEWLSPLLAIVPLQLLAYHLAVQQHLDVDRPRNLTKAVLLEDSL